MEFFDQEFYEQTIRLDGNSFVNCQFEDCVFLYGGHMGVTIQHCTMNDCSLQVDDHAAQTIVFMAKWHAIGGAAEIQIGTLLAGIIADELPPPLTEEP